MGTTTHASTLRSVSYTGHTEAAGVITLIRVSHSPREDARARPRTSDTGGDLPWSWPGRMVKHSKPQMWIFQTKIKKKKMTVIECPKTSAEELELFSFKSKSCVLITIRNQVSSTCRCPIFCCLVWFRRSSANWRSWRAWTPAVKQSPAARHLTSLGNTLRIPQAFIVQGVKGHLWIWRCHTWAS